MLIGWFLDNTARGEAQNEQARHALEGLLVGDVMSKDPVVVPSWITVELLVDQYAAGRQVSSFPTHSIDGRVDGLVTTRGIKKLPLQQRGLRRAIDIAIPAANVPIARRDETAHGSAQAARTGIRRPSDGLRLGPPRRDRLAERHLPAAPRRPGQAAGSRRDA